MAGRLRVPQVIVGLDSLATEAGQAVAAVSALKPAEALNDALAFSLSDLKPNRAEEVQADYKALEASHVTAFDAYSGTGL